YSVNEGSTVTATATGTDVEVDSLTYTWDLDNDGIFETPGQTVTLEGVDGPATYMVAVKVTDNGGLTAIGQTTVEVRNVPAIVSSISGPLDAKPVNTQVSFSADFSDPGLLDTHTGLWNWGDGMTMTGTI